MKSQGDILIASLPGAVTGLRPCRRGWPPPARTAPRWPRPSSVPSRGFPGSYGSSSTETFPHSVVRVGHVPGTMYTLMHGRVRARAHGAARGSEQNGEALGRQRASV